jgi:hypothetical protein
MIIIKWLIIAKEQNLSGAVKYPAGARPSKCIIIKWLIIAVLCLSIINHLTFHQRNILRQKTCIKQAHHDSKPVVSETAIQYSQRHPLFPIQSIRFWRTTHEIFRRIHEHLTDVHPLTRKHCVHCNLSSFAGSSRPSDPHCDHCTVNSCPHSVHNCRFIISSLRGCFLSEFRQRSFKIFDRTNVSQTFTERARMD